MKNKFNLTLYSIGVRLLLVLVCKSSFGQSIDNVKIDLIAGATHIEFVWKSDQSYELIKTGDKKYTILLPNLSESAAKSLTKWSDNNISKIEMEDDKKRNGVKVHFFLKKSSIDVFDYLTAENPKLIMDFYVNEEREKERKKKVKEVKVVKKKKVKKVEKQEIEKKVVKTNQDFQVSKRTPSSELFNLTEENKFLTKPTEESKKHGMFDGEDESYDRFKIKVEDIKEEAIIASKSNLYIPFPFLRMKVNTLPELMMFSPEFVIKDADNKETKEAQLLLQLFKKDRWESFIKVYNYFIKKYPQSKYEEIIKNVAGEYYLKKWLKNKKKIYLNEFKSIFKYLQNKYPDSVLNERNYLLPAYAELTRKNPTEAAKLLQEISEKFPYSVEFENVKMGTAYSLMDFGKFTRSEELMKEVAKNKKTEKGLEAHFRIGDVYLGGKLYRKARKHFSDVIAKYPKEAENQFPNAFFNLAEAMFWLGDYKRSLDNFVSFVKNYPSHKYGSYALTRIAELLEILGAPEENVVAVLKENLFRYNRHPGADVARVRLISKNIKSMKDIEFKDALKTLARIQKESPLEKIKQFIVLLKAQGFSGKKDYKTASNILINFYQKTPHLVSQYYFRKKIESLLVKDMNKSVLEKDFLNSLKLENKNSKTWLSKTKRIDIDYLKGRSYEMAGLWDEAVSYYQKTLKALIKIKGTQEEKEKRVHEFIPRIDQVKLRLSESFFQLGQINESAKLLREINTSNELSKEDRIEKGILISKIALKEEKINLAENNFKKILKEWKDESKYLAPVYFNYVKLLYKKGDYKSVIKQMSFIKDNDMSLLSKKNEYTLVKQLGDSLTREGENEKAISFYESSIKKFPEKDELKFRLGEIYYKKDDVKKAEKIWTGIENKTIQSQISDEHLNHNEWKKEYKKYLNRIPASASLKNERSNNE